MATSKDTVLVGCKIPNGLMLELDTFIKQTEQVIGGGVRESRIAARTGETFRLNGPAVPFGQRPTFDIKGGYAFTEVPKLFWEQWSKNHKDLLSTKQIIVAETADGLLGQARDFKDLKSGLQPLRREGKDPRFPRLPSGITIEEDKGKDGGDD